METNCIFCKIIAGELPSEKIYEDEDFIVIEDKFPKAPIHYLFIPNNHMPSVGYSDEDDAEILGQITTLAAQIAQEKELKDFKLVFNNGKYTEVPHLHLHLLAGPDLK